MNTLYLNKKDAVFVNRYALAFAQKGAKLLFVLFPYFKQVFKHLVVRPVFPEPFNAVYIFNNIGFEEGTKVVIKLFIGKRKPAPLGNSVGFV